MSGSDLIAAERARQVSVEGWTPEHDDEHARREMVVAAACYLGEEMPPGWVSPGAEDWPWEPGAWKPGAAIANLVRAGALVAAEIDRLQRLDGSA